MITWSIVNEVTRTILIFLRNAKQTIFLLLEVFVPEKLLPLLFFVHLFLFCYMVFAWFAFLWAQDFFVEKSWNCTDNLIYYTNSPVNPTIENLFVRTYFYLCESLIICKKIFFLWESFCISFLWSSVGIYFCNFLIK